MKNRRSHSTIAGNERLSILDELSDGDRGGNAFQRLMEYEIIRKTPFESTPRLSADRAIPVLRKKVTVHRGATEGLSADGTEAVRPGTSSGAGNRRYDSSGGPAPADGMNLLRPGLRERDLCGDREDVDLDGCGSCDELFYRVESSFQGLVEQAVRLAAAEHAPVLLTAGEERLLFDPDGGEMSTAIREQALAQLCRREIGHGLTATTTLVPEPVHHAGKGHRVAGSHRYPLDAFLWLTALLTSRGRLPEGTAWRKPVRLGQWSRLTRLAPISGALRIVPLWSAGQTGLHETPALLGVPQRNVFAFYSAARAVGMVE